MSERTIAAERLMTRPVFTDDELFAPDHGWEWARQTYAAWLSSPLSDAELRDLITMTVCDSPLSHFSGLHTPSHSAWVVRALRELQMFRLASALRSTGDKP